MMPDSGWLTSWAIDAVNALEGRHPRHMGELGAGPVQGLLGHFARCYVLHRADEHRPIRDLVGEAAQMLDHAAGGHNPEIEVGVGASHRPPDRALYNATSSGCTISPSLWIVTVDPGSNSQIR